ncbi:cellulose biosynthesis cyclic di-GMP-binding regulatory protein BcsB [Mycolicibacterium baixiangningiae]|uniref:cellulose biosynthesis cyclic di-GMP-binding regulatory protein BcsB n=1 Tax=Mycolicibacterium baixiangningiae TaxID=2761578 RepID=UPI0018E5E61B|nr:cellulose biosynthesis cyclic di-GMP-binding regulatory protein BcsB [Mycolicibacterium baixiangningiae]
MAVAPLFGTVTLPSAHAQPEPPGEVVLSFPTVGVSPRLELGNNVASEVNLPLPAGMSAVRLRGVIRDQANLGAGFLEVTDDNGTFLGMVEIPPRSARPAPLPFDIDISGARPKGSSLPLQFLVRTNDIPADCGPAQQLVVTDLAAVYSGDEPSPVTIATFFPPVLQRVTVVAPTDADPSEQQAVLTLVSTLTRLYNPQPVQVRVISSPRGTAPPPTGPMARAVVVERGSAGLAVEEAGNPGAFLRVSGRGDELTAQISLLDNELQSLAQVTRARVDQSASHQLPTGDTLTFSQLNLEGRAGVLRRSTFNIGVDRAALGGGRIAGVGVNLLADYTPVAGGDAAALTVRAHDTVVYTAPLNASGRVDATFDVPSQALTQRVALDFEITYTPGQECGPLIAPMEFAVDPRSTLQLVRGGPPLGGFGALPSEFSPRFYVAMDGSGQEQLGHAAAVVAAVSRATSTPMTPQVVDVKAAAEADSGALIVANSVAVEQTSLNPPIGGNRSAIDVGLPQNLRADIADGLGSIQVFADPPRDRTVVLVTTTDAWTLVDPLFGYLDGLAGGWNDLRGDVLAAGAAGTPVDLTVRAGGSDPFEPPNVVEHRAPWLGIGIGIGLAVVAVCTATVGLLLWRRRRTDAAERP